MIRVTFDDVTKVFGTQAVLKNISCTLVGGTIYAVTGANGSGKSTFLRLAGHLLRPSDGRIVVDGGGTPLAREALRRELGLLSPELALSPELTGEEAIAFLLGLRGITLTAEERAALLARVGLAPGDAQKRTKACSTGQRQRLALAVLIASNARLWLLDEPGANLDAAGRDVVRREARNAADRGALVLVATNDENEAAWADEVIALTEMVMQPKKPLPQGEVPSVSEAERVSKVRCNSNAKLPIEGSKNLPSTKSSTHTSGCTFDTPSGPSGQPPLRGGQKDAFLHLLRRELTSALRSRSSLAVMALFAITALLALSMALGGAILEPPLLAALLWTLLFFAASMGLGGSFAADEATGTLLALRVYGAGQAVLAGKTAFAFLTLAALAIVLVPLFFVLLDASCTAPLLLLATLLCGLAGLAGAGTLLSALTVGAANRPASAGGLLPVLLLPVILPVFLPAITLTSAALGGREAGLSMLVGMGLYDLLLIVSASLLFDSLWYED
ncbi:ATP-binding cassette domain-containing protein [Selenomonas sp.]|uniref:ATP-binding cassette domain-containing protein n=1 Tax=Selenomonas sp. TaxID=2053611 RepID=UPI002A814415|nr:ATP-binding cassette domain-containing protein [Selenomonas sp.]MDY4416995.1 ATP-binding cassette domain-containing protein [Selenomonas sp.]